MNYYNEFDPKASSALKQLISDGLIPFGHVDTRSITDVRASDLAGYTQCHFFAGIGGWSYALQLAGWEATRPVWTGSCPCQPFSTAGNRKGKQDERHLWPVWFDLIRECRPSVIFGEQVSAAITHGWLDDVYQGLESEGYAVGSAVLPACSVGAPHKRDRLWFVADSGGAGWGKRVLCQSRNTESALGSRRTVVVPQSSEICGDVADTQSERSGRAERSSCETSGRSTTGNSMQFRGASVQCGSLGDSQCHGRDGGAEFGSSGTRQNQGRVQQPEGSDTPRAMGNTEHNGSFVGSFSTGNGSAIFYDTQRANSTRKSQGTSQTCDVADSSGVYAQGCKDGSGQGQFGRNNQWHGGEWIDCPDGKQRLVEPGIPLLAHGIPERVGLLRAAGNAIVPQVAAEFIKAYKECKE